MIKLNSYNQHNKCGCRSYDRIIALLFLLIYINLNSYFYLFYFGELLSILLHPNRFQTILIFINIIK